MAQYTTTKYQTALANAFLDNWSRWQQAERNPAPSRRPTTVFKSDLTTITYDADAADAAEEILTTCCTPRDYTVIEATYLLKLPLPEAAEYVQRQGYKCRDKSAYGRLRKEALCTFQGAAKMYLHCNGLSDNLTA